MTAHNLTLRLVADPAAGTIAPEIGYWLTIEQVVPDDRITTGQAADMIDALFDLTPCKDPIESGTEPVEEPPADMEEALDKIAEKVEVDLTACERRLTGTYQTDLKIARSHQDIPYTLRLSVGEILETVIVESQVAENVDVKAASSVQLTMPVQSGLACTWLGTVYGPNGAIDPPVIKAAGSTLFWAGEATGTIRAEYASIHDLVTVEIPGVPYYVGTDRGEPQESTALAFYHYQVFPCDISPPEEEDEATLAEVCGWDSSSHTFEEEEEPEPEPVPPPEPVYGCVDHFPLHWDMEEPDTYEEYCCAGVVPPRGNCRETSFRREGGLELSEQTRIQMETEWGGPIEFIGLGPITPEGCGTRYEETKVLHHNCCDEVEPMAWDTATSVEVLAPNTYGIVGVTGGSGTYHWSVRGNDFWLDANHTLRDGTTATPYTRIYAGANACGVAPITVDDGCSAASGLIRATVGRWNLVYQSDGGLNGGSTAPPFEHADYLINSFDDPGSYGDKTGIKGKYKVVQLYTEYCPIAAAFSTLEAALTACAAADPAMYCAANAGYVQSGGAFYDSSMDCRQCGECRATYPAPYPHRSGNIGFSSIIYTAGPWYWVYGIWINVVSTYVYEWVC